MHWKPEMGVFWRQNWLQNQDQNSSKLLQLSHFKRVIFKTACWPALKSFYNLTSLCSHINSDNHKNNRKASPISIYSKTSATIRIRTIHELFLPPKLAQDHQFFLRKAKDIPATSKTPSPIMPIPSSINTTNTFPNAKKSSTRLWKFLSMTHNFCCFSVLTAAIPHRMSDKWASCCSVQGDMPPLTLLNLEVPNCSKLDKGNTHIYPNL